MAQRPGYPPTKKPAASAVGYAHGSNILRNFRQEDVVYALMTQLREKESELTLLTEQRKVLLQQQQINTQMNQQLTSKIDLHNRTIVEKDSRIAVLEQNLAQEKKGNGSAIAEANVKHLTETNFESKRILQERDDELSQLRPIMKEMKSKIEEYETKENIQHVEKLEEELAEANLQLAIAKDENITANNTIDQLEKKVKGKEWMIKALQDENEDQRSRENHLLARIKQLDEKIDTYETKFNGKGVDVPMLLAKLKDYEARTKEQQGQIRRLTNKKLNELVLRSSPVPHQKEEEEAKKKETKKKKSKNGRNLDDAEVDNESISDTSSFPANSLEQDVDEEDITLDSMGTGEEYGDDPFSAKSGQEEDVIKEFISDVKVGIESIGDVGLCCAQRPSPIPYRDPRSPESGYNTSCTFE